MKNWLRIIRVVQVREYKNALGSTYRKHRLNKWNPLTYIVLILGFILGVIMFGFKGVWREIDFKNPFKWS
jgi:preprotein translocase subunit SecF